MFNKQPMRHLVPITTLQIAQAIPHPVTVERALDELRALNAELQQLESRIAGLTKRAVN